MGGVDGGTPLSSSDEVCVSLKFYDEFACCAYAYFPKK